MSGNHPCDAYNTKHRMHNNDWDADEVKTESELQNVRVERGGDVGVNEEQHTFRSGSSISHHHKEGDAHAPPYGHHTIPNKMGAGGYVGFEESSSNMSPIVNFSDNTSCMRFEQQNSTNYHTRYPSSSSTTNSPYSNSCTQNFSNSDNSANIRYRKNSMVDPNKVLTDSNAGPHSTNIPPIHSIQHNRNQVKTDSNIPPPHPQAQGLKNNKQKTKKLLIKVEKAVKRSKLDRPSSRARGQVRPNEIYIGNKQEIKPVVYLPQRCMTKIKTIDVQTTRNPKCEISSNLSSNSTNRSHSSGNISSGNISGGNISFNGNSYSTNRSSHSHTSKRNRDNSCSSQGSTEYMGGYCVRMSKNSSLDDVQVREEVYSRADSTREIMAAKSEPYVIDLDKTRNRQMKVKNSGIVVHRGGNERDGIFVQNGRNSSKSVDFERHRSHHVFNDNQRPEGNYSERRQQNDRYNQYSHQNRPKQPKHINFEVNSHTETKTRTDQQTNVTVNIIAPPYQPHAYPYQENPNSASISKTQHNHFKNNEKLHTNKIKAQKPSTINSSKKLKLLHQLLETSDEDSDECIDKKNKKAALNELKDKAEFQIHHKLPSIKQGYVKNTNNIVRHNPWGSISYKELITDAILDQPGRKAKLQEIYEYMIEHYEYFQNRSGAKDERRKQWTNSVRHNLSSHKEHFKLLKQGGGFFTNNYSEKIGGHWTLHSAAMEKALNPQDSTDTSEAET